MVVAFPEIVATFVIAYNSYIYIYLFCRVYFHEKNR